MVIKCVIFTLKQAKRFCKELNFSVGQKCYSYSLPPEEGKKKYVLCN